ncbi:TetR/AcrR family transcriptional regulator [Nocardia sp. NEAU-G5]|uniref:TetR/AcrR family transcriptional regulator n=1 Tax=Nocardia albiluteola TaxID=2842303 RepID=A0ABS6ASN4_9NOCA|nr:TetR/AcrR family transcriptional regulator [Nocardia albiluteola]MBU3061044.1 TetR/AcrR family transcriptional regulator [Nocardia albiluteola]
MSASIATLAEFGYTGTSFTKIAGAAQLSSTRLISYHFGGKDDLMTAVVNQIVEAAVEFMTPRIAAEGGHWARVAAYITSNLEFLHAHPDQLRALVEIRNFARTPEGVPLVDAVSSANAVAGIHALLHAGQEAGEFASFDTHVMAVTIRAAIDTAGVRYATGLESELEQYADQLVELFGRAVLAGVTRG